MKFKTHVVCTGMKRAKGDYEGTAYDSTTAYIEVEMDESTKNARGKATQDYKLGTSEVYDTFANVQFPFRAEAEFEFTTNGKTQKQRLLSLVPAKV